MHNCKHLIEVDIKIQICKILKILDYDTHASEIIYHWIKSLFR